MTTDQALMLEAARVAAARRDPALLDLLVRVGSARAAVDAAQTTYDALRGQLVALLGGDPTNGDCGAPAAPLALRVGLTFDDVRRLDFGGCATNKLGCTCSACQIVDSLGCACGHGFVDHYPGDAAGHINVGGCSDCDACTGFSLVTWLGGLRVPPAPPPDAPPPPPAGDVARQATSPAAPAPGAPRRRDRSAARAQR